MNFSNIKKNGETSKNLKEEIHIKKVNEAENSNENILCCQRLFGFIEKIDEKRKQDDLIRNSPQPISQIPKNESEIVNRNQNENDNRNEYGIENKNENLHENNKAGGANINENGDRVTSTSTSTSPSTFISELNAPSDHPIVSYSSPSSSSSSNGKKRKNIDEYFPSHKSSKKNNENNENGESKDNNKMK